MNFSLSTGTLYVYPLRTVFRWARAAGFDGVELVVNPEAILRGGRAVRRMAEAEGLAIFSVHPTVVPLPAWRERHGGLGRTIRLAQEAGAGLAVLHTPRLERLDSQDGFAFRRQLDAWQAELGGGLRLAMENKAVRDEVHRRYALTSLDRLRTFAEEHDLGLVLDTTHAATSGEDLRRARQTLDGRLVNVHLSDVGGSLARLPFRSASALLGEHRFPGDGDQPLADLLADLAASRYAGPVTLEVSPQALRFWWPPAVRRRLAQAAAWMRQAAKGG